MNNRTELRAHIQRLLADKGDREPLSETDSLVLSGRLDSVDILQIVVFLESNYGIDFADQDSTRRISIPSLKSSC